MIPLAAATFCLTLIVIRSLRARNDVKFEKLIFLFCLSVLQLVEDLLNPSPVTEARKHKLKRLVQGPNSFFMDVKCPGNNHYYHIFPVSPTAHPQFVLTHPRKNCFHFNCTNLEHPKQKSLIYFNFF